MVTIIPCFGSTIIIDYLSRHESFVNDKIFMAFWCGLGMLEMQTQIFPQKL
jgi:hypothetical protein